MYESGLEAFLSILNCGGFSAASEQLNLTQSTVSHRLMDLEKKIGARLIERGRDMRTIELTSVGKKLLPIAEKWRDVADEIRDIRSLERMISLAIVTVDTVNSYIFPPLYTLLSRNGVNLRISSRKSVDIPVLVEKREFDIGYAFQIRMTSNIIVKELFREKIVLLRPAAKGGREDPGPVENESLEQENEIYFDTWGPGYEVWHSQWWPAENPHRLEIDTPSVFNSLVSNPKQWSLVPLCMARHFSGTGKFLIRDLRNPPPDRICYEIRNRHTRYDAQPGIKLMRKFMKKLQIGLAN